MIVAGLHVGADDAAAAGALLAALAADEPALGVEAVAVGAAAVGAEDADLRLSASIFRMRLPAMSLKKTLPSASTAGPSRKQTVAAASATAFGATRPDGKPSCGPSPADYCKPTEDGQHDDVKQRTTGMGILQEKQLFFDSGSMRDFPIK